MQIAKLFLLLSMTPPAQAWTLRSQLRMVVPRPAPQMEFDQKIGAALPEVFLQDEEGKRVSLKTLQSGRPALLALGYYGCSGLCSVLLERLFKATYGLPLKVGRDFEVLFVSIKPSESSQLAREKKKNYLDHFRPGLSPERAEAERGWHFLTAPEKESQALAEAVGYRYRKDPGSGDYAHPTGVIVLTADGRVSRYLLGLQYPERDLRLALVEASHQRLGRLSDRLLLTCFHYDPKRGTYSFMAARAVNASAVLGALLVGAWLLRAFYLERKKTRLS